MQDEKKLDKTLERFYNRFNAYNTKVLETLGNVIKQFDGLDENQAHALAQELKLGYDLNKMENELAKISGKTVQDIDILFDKVAQENVEFSEVYFYAKNLEYADYKNNTQLQDLVESIKRQTDDTFKNLSKSKNIGFVLKDDKNNLVYKPLSKVYNELIDEATYYVSTGIQDYQKGMIKTIRGLADSGVRIHEESVNYKNGYNRRIDSAVRQDILTGLRKINLGVQEEVGKRFGADGVEISAHSPCAEDHLSIQGKQFSKKEFEKLNGNLDRPIGEYNCRHFVFSIILGVNLPSYTNELLNEYKQDSISKVEYEGKTYTRYEATQVQRKLETAVRRQKDRNVIAKASGNQEEIAKSQEKIRQLTGEYYKFSKSTNLKIYKHRMNVVGYDKI